MEPRPDFSLYLITDRKMFPGSSLLYAAIEEALKGGLKALQLREKDIGVRELLAMGYALREMTAKYGAKLFINDRVDVAMAVEADGVQLGQGGIPPSAASKASKGKLLIGVSAHSLQEAYDAEKDGADFITFGPVYATPSKLAYGEPVGTGALGSIMRAVSIPVLAIGGITLERIKDVMAAGADGVAVISAILGSGEIRKTTERFLRYLNDQN